MTCSIVSGQDVDKRQYTLVNPVPFDMMRELSADRPDATESPITVDAGHVQIEMSFVDYAYDHSEIGSGEAWTVMDTNLKIGLLHNVDLQFVFGAYSRVDLDVSNGPDPTLEGFGDVQVRTKINLWGNDGGDTAFAIMPFIQIPTGTDVGSDDTQGGVIFSLGWDVAPTWGLGFQVETDWVYDEEDRGYDTEVSHTTVLGFDVAGPLGAYVEYIGVISGDADTDYQAIASCGVTYAVHDNLTLDLGSQIGITEDADDLNVFTGMTVRF